ncbi:MAG: RNA-binding protein [Thermoprotei archaeon]|nr:MAG: RNA-binding protein [Thermoprotei archaeon]
MSVELGKPAIVEASTPPICTSCKRIVGPSDKGVSFLCPNCGAILIWRCRFCRKNVIPYRCPNCGFEGP